jgi:hypothetical protein
VRRTTDVEEERARKAHRKPDVVLSARDSVEPFERIELRQFAGSYDNATYFAGGKRSFQLACITH